eukprot:Nk52_evm22s348 gene=Nk52_evmTU22s348
MGDDDKGQHVEGGRVVDCEDFKDIDRFIGNSSGMFSFEDQPSGKVREGRYLFEFEILPNRVTRVLFWGFWIAVLGLMGFEVLNYFFITQVNNYTSAHCTLESEYEGCLISADVPGNEYRMWYKNIESSTNIKAFYSLFMQVENIHNRTEQLAYLVQANVIDYKFLRGEYIDVIPATVNDTVSFNCTEGIPFCSRVMLIPMNSFQTLSGFLSGADQSIIITISHATEALEDELPNEVKIKFVTLSEVAVFTALSVALLFRLLLYTIAIFIGGMMFSRLGWNMLKWPAQCRFGILMAVGGALYLNPVIEEYLFFVETDNAMLLNVGSYLYIVGLGIAVLGQLMVIESLYHRTCSRKVHGSIIWKALVVVLYMGTAVSVLLTLQYFIDNVSLEIILASLLLLSFLELFFYLLSIIWALCKIIILNRKLRRYPYILGRFRYLAAKTLLVLSITNVGVFAFVVIMNYVSAKSLGYGIISFDDDDENTEQNSGSILQSTTMLSTHRILKALIFLYMSALFVPSKKFAFPLQHFSRKAESFSVWEMRWMITFASEAYRLNSSEGKRLQPQLHKYTLLKQVTDLETDSNALIAEKDGYIVVSFRGTKSRKNLKSDIRTKQVSLFKREERSWMQNLVSSPCLVHRGFKECHQAIKDEVIEAILKHHKGDKPVKITGHSLGGALAILLSYELSKKYSISSTVYVFGCPRVGNETFANDFKEAVPECFRLSMDGDIVTGLPKWGYRHVGKNVVLDRNGNIFMSPSTVEKFVILSRRTQMSVHKMGVYRHAVNAALKIIHWVENRKESIHHNEKILPNNDQSLGKGLESILPMAFTPALSTNAVTMLRIEEQLLRQ